MSGPGNAKEIRGAVFDLDEVLLDKRAAWTYTIEQSLLSVTGARVDPTLLAAEYRHRPWREALRVLEVNGEHVRAAADLCGKMWERSALKRITVHEGIGMALAALLAGGVSMAAVTSVPLPLASRQAQAAGVDRFLVALEPHPEDVGGYARIAQLFRVGSAGVAFVSGDQTSLDAAAMEGLRPFQAAWAPGAVGQFPRFEEPVDFRVLRAGIGPAASAIE